MKEDVKTDKAPGAIGPYSQGIDMGNTIFFLWANPFKSNNWRNACRN